MMIDVPVDLNGTDSNPTQSDSVSEALKGFLGVRSNVLRGTLRLLPWVILLLLIVLGVIILRLRDPMFTSGVVAAALSLFSFQILMSRIPETLSTIWSRDLIAVQSKPNADCEPSAEETSSSNSHCADTALLEKQYLKFIADTENMLNNVGQWIMAIFFALLVGTWTYLFGQDVERMMRIVDRLLYHRDLPPEMASLLAKLLTGFVIVMEVFVGIVLGLMVWRMWIIGVRVWRLGKKFDLKVQLGHPDQCGGFEPLGYLCLWNALILTVPAVFLGTWIIFGLGTRYARYESLFPTLLLVPMALSIASFFLPIWRIHREMVGQRAKVRRQLDQLSQSIDHLARDMLNRADELEPEEGEKMAKKLDLVRRIYEQSEHYPVWPINMSILARFLSSQAVPVLGLTGLGKGILNAVGVLAGFLGES